MSDVHDENRPVGEADKRLVECPECGAPSGSRSKECVRCGSPLPRPDRPADNEESSDHEPPDRVPPTAVIQPTTGPGLALLGLWFILG